MYLCHMCCVIDQACLGVKITQCSTRGRPQRGGVVWKARLHPTHMSRGGSWTFDAQLTHMRDSIIHVVTSFSLSLFIKRKLHKRRCVWALPRITPPRGPLHPSSRSLTSNFLSDTPLQSHSRTAYPPTNTEHKHKEEPVARCHALVPACVPETLPLLAALLASSLSSQPSAFASSASRKP